MVYEFQLKVGVYLQKILCLRWSVGTFHAIHFIYPEIDGTRQGLAKKADSI